MRHVCRVLVVVVLTTLGCSNRNNPNDPYGGVTSENYSDANRAMRRGRTRQQRRRARQRYPRAEFRDRELERSILMGVRRFARREGWSEHLRKVRVVESFPHGYEIVVGGRFNSQRCVLHRMRVMAGYDGEFVVSDAIEVRRIACRAL